jgi:hypothetical protein
VRPGDRGAGHAGGNGVDPRRAPVARGGDDGLERCNGPIGVRARSGRVGTFLDAHDDHGADGRGDDRGRARQKGGRANRTGGRGRNLPANPGVTSPVTGRRPPDSQAVTAARGVGAAHGPEYPLCTPSPVNVHHDRVIPRNLRP